MSIKRLGKFFIIFIIIMGIGVFAIDYAGRKLNLPGYLSNFILVGFVIFSIGVAFFIGRTTPHEEELDEEDVIISSEKASKGKRYAWLLPTESEAKAGYPLTKKLTIVGRDVNSDILINDLSVSRKHGQILFLGGGFILKDLDSNNGTFINNQRIEEVYLGDGDIITFGEVKFKFDCSGVKPKPEHLSDVDISLDIDLDLGDLGTHITGIETGSRLSGTIPRTGTRSGARFKDLERERTFTPLSKKSDDEDDNGTGTNPIND